MINLQKLRQLSCICAYCNKVMPLSERTNDHLIPQSMGGVTETYNIVICCQDCNNMKAAIEVNTFLEEHPDKREAFYNYLNMIDYQCGNNEYSKAIIKNLSDSWQSEFAKRRRKNKAKRLKRKKQKEENKEIQKAIEVQDIGYSVDSTGKSFYVSELQSKILDYYLEHSDFKAHKQLAKELGISNERILKEIICINNLTGLFRLKKVSENGIVLNDLFSANLSKEIKKS